MAALFGVDDAEGVFRSGLPRALAVANRAFEEVRRGRVEARELVISKRLSRELSLYRSLQAHVVAALLGAEEEGNPRYVFVNSESSNPFLRVKPSFMVGEAGDRYDRKKYVVLTKRAVMSLLSPFVDEEGLTAQRIRATNLEDFIRV